MNRSWFFSFAIFVFAGALANSQVKLDSSVTMVLDPREPVSIRKAAADLAADFGKVFGKPIRIVAGASDAGATAVCIAFRYNIPPGLERPATREALQIQAVKTPWPGARVANAVVLSGSDERGTIYAVYEFSRRFLGVDPLYWWTDHEPPRRSSVTVPAGFRERQGRPTFRYRGWFINDEDLLTGWKPGVADGTGISLQVWDRIFEALLRLKGNMIVPGTFLFPDEPQVRAAGERGLIISQHHIEVVGLNTYRWPQDRPYSLLRRPDLLEAAWRTAVRQYAPGQEIIWTLGFRGQHDRPFWSDDPEAPTSDAERARAIRTAIDKQMVIVRAERSQPYFLMNAWMEAVPFIRSGMLRIPDGVALVWPDNGHGVIRDDGTITAGQGIYYHTAMLNGRANQLTEMVPLERIRRELSRAAQAGATEYLLVNTSDIRPVVMTTRAVMELAWEAGPWSAPGYDLEYLHRWCVEEFGDRASTLVEKYYRAYFDAPGRYGSAEHETLADNAYYTEAREIAKRLERGDNSAPRSLFPNAKDLAEYGSRLATICRGADGRWQRVEALANNALAAVLPERKRFFQAHVLTQAGIQLHSNRMLLHVAEAAAAGRAERARAVAAAAREADLAITALEAADYGKWAGFSRGDLLVNVRSVALFLHACAARLDGQDVALPPAPPVGYTVIKAYQGNRRVAFQ